VSLPLPPSSVSLPAPPNRVSFPVPPVSESAPAPAFTHSVPVSALPSRRRLSLWVIAVPSNSTGEDAVASTFWCNAKRTVPPPRNSKRSMPVTVLAPNTTVEA
jgi:hypothetical protein